jgi:hypothetical protein
MPKKRKINTRDIVNDIRSGMDDASLMDKYLLTAKGLQSAFDKLVDVKAITRGELCSRSPLRDDTVNVENLRAEPRNFLAMSLSVRDVEKPDRVGEINDISDKGLQVAGIDASKDEIIEFVVEADEATHVERCVLRAACRWTAKGPNGKGPTAGFEIIEISEGSQRGIALIKQAYGFDEQTA